MSQDEVLPCSNGFSPPVPFFTCRNQMGRVPYTLVCDFQSDCCDESDEDFCQIPTCGSRREFECADGKQCVHRDRVCDKRSDCVDKSDEMKCRDILTASDVPVNIIEPPARVDFTGRGNFTVTRLHNTSCPETHFQCPGKGYCLPVYVRCNRVNDCPGKEDEKNCDHYTCPGFYRCRYSKICLHRQHLCDGVFQCPQHDDEWLCNVTCPDTCYCYGHAFICTGSFTADTYPELRYVDASGICVPLPITRKQFGGSGYAFGVIIILNFVLFLFIAVGQFLIYWSIRINTIGCSDNKRKSRDMAIARRLLAVVLTDFMCWFPIGLLGMMARSGEPISGEINVAIAIFVLPFNSALNPFLYTLNVVRERRQKMANVQKSQTENKNRTGVFDVMSERIKENT
ncbi:hypothetical protein ACOMHN_037082 [Nucella lapillus]